MAEQINKEISNIKDIVIKNQEQTIESSNQIIKLKDSFKDFKETIRLTNIDNNINNDNENNNDINLEDETTKMIFESLLKSNIFDNNSGTLNISDELINSDEDIEDTPLEDEEKKSLLISETELTSDIQEEIIKFKNNKIDIVEELELPNELVN